MEDTVLARKRQGGVLCNECCWFGCKDRKACYEAVSRKNLGENREHHCTAPESEQGYCFSKAMQNPGFIGIEAIKMFTFQWDFLILRSRDGDLEVH